MLQGLVSGVVVAGYGGGALIFDQVPTLNAMRESRRKAINGVLYETLLLITQE